MNILCWRLSRRGIHVALLRDDRRFVVTNASICHAVCLLSVAEFINLTGLLLVEMLGFPRSSRKRMKHGKNVKVTTFWIWKKRKKLLKT